MYFFVEYLPEGGKKKRPKHVVGVRLVCTLLYLFDFCENVHH